MTPKEAERVLLTAIGAAAAREMDPETLLLLQSHLVPLPYERTRDHVLRYAIGHKWVSSLQELCEAAGVPASAAADLVRAVLEGGQLVRDLRSASGWSYVAPNDPLPRGALEAAAVAGESVAPPPEPPALPAGGMIRGVLRDRDRRIAALLGARRVPSEPMRPAPRPEVLESELAAYEARFKAQEQAREQAQAPAGGER
jgi:hypothetical protein